MKLTIGLKIALILTTGVVLIEAIPSLITVNAENDSPRFTHITPKEEVSTTCVNYDDCLYKDLFQNYNKRVRPVLDSSQPVNITIKLVVNSLLDIKEKDEMIIIVGFLRTIWYDEFLTWDPQKYGGQDHLIIPAENIWLPDVAISNSATNFYDETHKTQFHVEIKSDGQIRWAFGGIFSSNCHINLKHYPFDSQTCHMEIENWMYSLHDVNLNFSSEESVDITALEPNAVWQYDGSEVVRTVKYDKFASLKFTMTWKRKTLYYYVNIVIPIVLMLLVALGVFWLPAECGEKMSLAITVLLAFSVFQIIIMENTPVNSDDVPNITQLVMLVTCIATSSLLVSMLVVYISLRSPNKRPPSWLRNICFNYLARILCIKTSVPKHSGELTREDNEPKTSNNTVLQNGLNKIEPIENVPKKLDASSKKFKPIIESLDKIRNIMEEHEHSDYVRDEWRYIGIIVDRVAFWVIFILMALCLIIINVD